MMMLEKNVSMERIVLIYQVLILCRNKKKTTSREKNAKKIDEANKQINMKWKKKTRTQNKVDG